MDSVWGGGSQGLGVILILWRAIFLESSDVCFHYFFISKSIITITLKKVKLPFIPFRFSAILSI